MVGTPTVISTFAGCGGSSLGYQWAGFRELLAVEWDDHAVATFKANFADVPVWHGDIAQLSVDECLRRAGGLKVGELDVLDGSPPCQGFSTAGKRRYDDPRNSLFGEFARLLQGLQPRAFVMENVTGMVKGHMKQAYLEIIRTLRGCGYKAKGQVMNAAYFGVPQLRKRVIIVGVREDLDEEPSHPKPAGRMIPVSSIIPGCRGTRSQRINPWIGAMQPAATICKVSAGYRIRANGGMRKPTIGEAAAICSFPPDFRLTGSDTQKWARLGNSVPPKLMEAVASHVKSEILEQADA